MYDFTVNLVLACGSLAILGALLFTVQDSAGNRSLKLRYSHVILSFLITVFMYLMRIILENRGGGAVHVLLNLTAEMEQIFCAVSYPLLIHYLYPVKNRSRMNRLARVLMGIIFLLSAIIVLLCLSNPVTGFLFRVNEHNMFIRGPLMYLPETFTMLEIAALTAMVYSTPEARRKRAPVLIFFLIIFCGLMALYFNPDIFLIYPLSVLSLLLIYVNIIDQQEQDLRRRQVELNNNRISLLIGQIQPHFVFNILNTIYYLCDTDPKSASAATERLRLYLQNNYEERFSETPIPFEKELEIVKNYTDLEKLRFEQIEIIYDIKDMDFSLPALSVQPLVENAIRHGLREMREGRVIISSAFENGQHVISVIDNGIGYKDEPADDRRRHVGIENVRRRLTMMSDASLEILALEEGGTAATIRISD